MLSVFLFVFGFGFDFSCDLAYGGFTPGVVDC